MLEFGAALPRIRHRVEGRPRRAGRHDAGPDDGARDHRPPARHDAGPRRQRGIRAQQPLVRPDHPAHPARGGAGQPAAPALSRQERHRARGRARGSARRARRPPLPGDARPGAVPVRGRGRRAAASSIRPTSTTTSARRPARTSRPRTSAPGTRTVHALDLWAEQCARRAVVPPHGATSCSAEVAKRLGNTVAVCKKSYVHPHVLETLASIADPDELARLSPARAGPASSPPSAACSPSWPRPDKTQAAGRAGAGLPYTLPTGRSNVAGGESMEEATVLVAMQAAVRTLALNRPKALNSFTAAMHGELLAALDAAAADASVRCLVVTGSGRGFCAGQDLADPVGRAEPRGRRDADRRRRGDRALLQAAGAARPLDARAGASPPSTASPPAPARTSRCAATSSSPRARRASSRPSRRSA